MQRSSKLPDSPKHLFPTWNEISPTKSATVSKSTTPRSKLGSEPRISFTWVDPEAKLPFWATQPKKDYVDVGPVIPIDTNEMRRWSFYRATIAEFMATMMFIYFGLSTIIGAGREAAESGGIGMVGVAWCFGGMIFVLVYCTSGISGGHLNPSVTFGLMVARKVTINRAFFYICAQMSGATCGAAIVKASNIYWDEFNGGCNAIHEGYSVGAGFIAEVMGTFLLMYTVLSATDPKQTARDSHVPILAPLPIGFAVFMVHLATISITGTGINPARSFGSAVNQSCWKDHWIFWIGPFLGATLASVYYKYILRAALYKEITEFMQYLGVQ
ncbi:hypothetical protein KC19_VG139500 [Ceratodon purpureus]|uniref:Aquaporin n=1 Tax=Ceratodon purpureus TaxID=3225 RepID=A0A8T0HR08_CERPU|nr:hypothetical protein KC19_VG139500 [Ceratodon purpureus]KAG0572992.1 hypothetical protein KC19_VG139500 [Ceratodon purpureus]KAG0572993.1 hypothetical protein KC19_VG139500 [Ceratodon purpureus]KAG0572996.1 hypothetical protein KC19_VG139500 [Ceratodon purpureus]